MARRPRKQVDGVPLGDDGQPLRLRVYNPEPTARRFHASRAFVRGIKGPVGTGKTVVCCMEVFSRALEQKPFNNVRKTRWAFVRNTYPELISTTMATWKDWVPEAICPISMAPPISAKLNMPLADGTRVYMEIIFLAMDSEEDIGKMKSLEVTGIFINEASEIRKSVLDIATTRVNRYPAEIDGGFSWSGIIMDTNPPPDDHWWFDLAEIQKPKGFEFFDIPPALIPRPVKKDIKQAGKRGLSILSSKDMIPDYVPNRGQSTYSPAENVKNHSIGFDYWLKMIEGKDPEWIKVYVMGQYGTVISGKPVYNEFIDSFHTAQEPLEPYRGLPLLLGWDFGLTPACAIGQLSPKGQLRVIDEVVSLDMGIQRFVREMVIPKLATTYAGIPVISTGDPAGSQRSTTDEVTCMQILAEEGIVTDPAGTNSFIARREAVVSFLTRLIEGEPGFVLSPTCDFLRKGFLGRYHFAKMRVGGSDRFKERPDKNIFSHIHDALQYLCLSARGDGGATSGGFGLARGPEIREVVRGNAAGWT